MRPSTWPIGDCLSLRLQEGISGEALDESGDLVLTSAVCDLGEGRDSVRECLLAAGAVLGILNTSSHPRKEVMDMSGVPKVRPFECSLHGICQYPRTACNTTYLICI